jgi:2,3-bisphosphoglycerate-independent phosphoglycerate mutase
VRGSALSAVGAHPTLIGMPRILLLFVDGVGLGDDDAAINPFMSAALPALHGVLGVRAITRGATPRHAADASLVGVDATLGFDGTPQSGTGQAALLTGLNAVAIHGGHFGPWVPARLRPLVSTESVLAVAQAAGHTVAFANAYPEEVLQLMTDNGGSRPSDAAAAVPSDAPDARTGRRRRAPAFLRAGPPVAAFGAGLLTRHTAALEVGDAVASEITNEGWRERLARSTVPVIDAARAGRNLSRIANRYDLTMFAHYATDYAGHTRDLDKAVIALERFDSFMGGVLAGIDRDALIFVVADHGNIEDVRTGHTRNPALGLVIGNGHALSARRLHSLMDVTPAILDLLRL